MGVALSAPSIKMLGQAAGRQGGLGSGFRGLGPLLVHEMRCKEWPCSQVNKPGAQDTGARARSLAEHLNNQWRHWDLDSREQGLEIGVELWLEIQGARRRSLQETEDWDKGQTSPKQNQVLGWPYKVRSLQAARAAPPGCS